MKIIQICGCVMDGPGDDITPFVSNQCAEFYGIYLSQPDGRYVWVKDEKGLNDARETAHLMVTQGMADEINDSTFDEETP